LNRREIDKIEREAKQTGYSSVCLAIYWKGNKIKAEIALVKGKQLHDKRAALKEKEWGRDKQRTVKQYNR
jgi:SsrA-binding protein